MMIPITKAKAEAGGGHERDPMDGCYDKTMEERTNRNKALHKVVSRGLLSRHNLRQEKKPLLLRPPPTFWTHFLPQQLKILLAEDDDST